MRFGVAVLTAGVLAGGLLTTGVLEAAKPTPPPRWPCQITFRDAAGDVIKSDTPTGSASWPKPYVDGVDGVTCGISQAAGTGEYEWLTLVFDSRSPRYLNYVGQQFEGSSYTSFTNRDYFQVKQMATVSWDPANPTAFDMRPFRAFAADSQFAKGEGRFQGDSDFTGNVPGGTSSVFVQPLDACSWQVWFDPSAPLVATATGEWADTRVNPRVMQVSESTGYKVTRGYFPMPFSVVVKVISGKPGCPLP